MTFQALSFPLAMHRRAACWAAVTALLCAAPVTAWADTPDPMVEEAKELFQQARVALKQGDLAQALVWFRKSYRRHPTAGTLLNMANCEEQLGLTASAWIHYRDLAAQLPADDERRPLALERTAALKQRVARLQFHLAPNAPLGTRVMLDNVEMMPWDLWSPVPVDPIGHVIIAIAPDRLERRYTVTAIEGKLEQVTIEPGQEAAKAEPIAAAAPSPPSGDRARTAGFILGSAGLAGLGIGGVTGILSIAKNNELAHLCPQPKQCTGDDVAIEGTGKAFAAASTVAFAVGLSALGVGTYLVLSNREKTPATAALAPLLLPGGGGLGANGTF